MALITQAEYARRIGISREAVRKQVKSGKLRLVDKLIDTELAEKDIKKTLSTNEQLLRAKLQNEIEKGKILKLEVAEKEQSLIPADKVQETLFSKGRVIRDAFLNLPDRVSSQLEMQNAQTIHTTLTKEIRTILEELSNG